MIAMVQEEKQLSNAKLEKIQETAPVENEEVEEEESPYNASTMQEKILMMVHDAIYMTVKETGKYDPIAVRNWFGYSKDVRGIVKFMPEDEFNAAFGKMAEAIIKEISEETEE